VGASLLANAVEATKITAGANNNCTTNRMTTTRITCPANRHHMDVTMELATPTLVVITGVVVVMVMALVLSAVLPGIRPSSALR